MSTIPPWVSFIVHPQVPSVCDAYADFFPWPEDGFGGPYVLGSRMTLTRWPVPWLKGARLVDCGHCGKTGIQARTPEDMVRYLPGAKLEDDKIILANVLDPIQMADGSGRDEETVSDEMVDRALAVLADYWIPPHLSPNTAEYLTGTPAKHEHIQQLAALRKAEDDVLRKNREFIRQVIQAALEVLPDAHRN